jgi:hypothetical protein
MTKDSLQRSTPIESEPKPSSRKSINGVFIQRAKGTSFEEFVENCIQLLREKGLLSD